MTRGQLFAGECGPGSALGFLVRSSPFFPQFVGILNLGLSFDTE